MRRPSPASLFQSRVRAWALRRQGTDVLPLKFAARRVYILPTPAGWTFALLLGVMFMAGMNYGNGLALLFTFWLAGFALVAMVQTQRALTGTQIIAAEIEPAHAGGAVALRLVVACAHVPQDLALRADAIGAPFAPATPAIGNDAGGVLLQVPVTRRGRWHAPPLHLSSTAPFGLFRTWTWLQLELSTLVYPAAHGTRPEPQSAGDSQGSVPLAHGLDELAWLRDFREGDSPRQVAWKAYARGQPLLVREYHGEGALRQEFDFDAITGMDVEARLCQLTRWIIDAHARGDSWVLKLPGATPLAGAGEAQLSLCLARLALHGNEEAR